jgi:hypothetical protein
MTTDRTVTHLAGTDFQKSRAFSPAIVTQGGKVAKSVWKMQCEGRNRFGQFGAWFPIDEVETFRANPDDFFLLGFLRAHNHPDSTFMVANGLAERFGWNRKRLAASRRRLTGRHIRLICPARDHQPALYRWTRSGDRVAEIDHLSSTNTFSPLDQG